MEPITAPYRPISCDQYDQLEILAMSRTPASFGIRQNQGVVEVAGTIRTLTTQNKLEYLHLTDGQVFQLDELVTINGQPLDSFCGL